MLLPAYLPVRYKYRTTALQNKHSKKTKKLVSHRQSQETIDLSTCVGGSRGVFDGRRVHQR